jgi:hypothetical protein
MDSGMLHGLAFFGNNQGNSVVLDYPTTFLALRCRK